MFKLNLGAWNHIFAVPAAIVDEHIAAAGGVAWKVLLLLLRHPENEMSATELAAKLNLPQSEVWDAVNYWIAHQILLQDATADENTFSSISTAPVHTTPPTAPITHRISQSTPVRLMGKELEQKVQSNNELKFLIREAELCLNKPLIASDAAVLVSLYDWAGLSVDLILMIISYSISIGKNNLRSIERIALEWIDQGIDTHEKVEEHIKQLMERNNNESAIKTAFGIFDRKLTSKERGYIDIWLKEWKFEMPMLRLAYEKTIDQIGKLSFPYINKILQSWYNLQLRTPEDVSRKDQKTPATKSADSSFDLDAIDKMTIEKII